MFASAATLLDKADSANASYLDLAQLVSDQGAQSAVSADLEQLFRRALFNVLVANRDDHLRNHGFIRTRTGWRMAPAYDMNPNSYAREHVLTLDGKIAVPDVKLVMETAELYRLTPARAREVLEHVSVAVGQWHSEARKAGLSADEVSRMRPLFERR
jgi:serine/threonine-protein kinase HipA